MASIIHHLAWFGTLMFADGFLILAITVVRARKEDELGSIYIAREMFDRNVLKTPGPLAFGWGMMACGGILYFSNTLALIVLALLET